MPAHSTNLQGVKEVADGPPSGDGTRGGRQNGGDQGSMITLPTGECGAAASAFHLLPLM